MSDDRLRTLSTQVEEASRALHDLSKDERSSYRDEILRLERVLGYAGVVIETSDPDLLSDGTFNQISEGLAQIINNPAAAGTNSGPWASAILDAVGRLPTAHDRDVEQEVKAAAANFKRSASQRLAGLEEDIAETKSAAGERRAELEGQLTELRGAIDDEKARLGQLGTEQTETFREAQGRRAEEVESHTGQLDAQIEGATTSAAEKVDAQVREMDRVKEEMTDLSGAVALVGTSERYGTEAKTQFWAANFWAALTIVLALLAVVAAAHAAGADNPDETEFIGRLAIGAILAGISRYTAIQSSRARGREKEARAVQLDLSAFGPFIEPLERAQQEEERVIMTRKTFGKARGQDLGEDDPGPMPLSHLMQRRKAKNMTELEEAAA